MNISDFYECEIILNSGRSGALQLQLDSVVIKVENMGRFNHEKACNTLSLQCFSIMS